MKVRARWALLFLCVVLSLIFLGVLAYLGHRELQPVPRLSSAEDIQRFFPGHKGTFLRKVKSGEVLLIVGKLPSKMTLPSGPPHYIYKKDGLLLDWTHDIGDDRNFRERWRDVVDERVTLREVRVWLATGEPGK